MTTITQAIESMPEAEWELRKLLWEEHACPLKYGDDGERQCASCRIDFVRDPVSVIKARTQERNETRMVEYLNSRKAPIRMECSECGIESTEDECPECGAKTEPVDRDGI